MVRVAFLIDYEHYIGGVNYIKNLLSAVALVGCSDFKPYVFLGMNAKHSTVEQFKKVATVVQSVYLDRSTYHWHQYKLLFKTTGLLPSINKLMKQHKIDVISHSSIYGQHLPYKTINWLPDFQFARLPDMFSFSDRFKANKHFKASTQLSDRLIISSYDAQNDLEKYYPGHKEKSCVLQFVVQPDPSVYEINQKQGLDIEKKYGIDTKYFYMPNQFWKHKNHLVVFQAVSFLKKNGVEVCLICSGNLSDFRRNNKNHIGHLLDYIARNGLNKNIHLLGIIPYQHVGYFIRNSISIINPSSFEGWSSTVEEAKSIGKKVILSDINVHREQAPEEASYFELQDSTRLAEILSFQWDNCTGGPDWVLERKAKLALDERVNLFGRNYLNCIAEL